jgi:hypothetical protein
MRRYPDSYTAIQRNGIVIHFETAGTLAEFNFSALLTALLNGVVLLSVANTLYAFIAAWWFFSAAVAVAVAVGVVVVVVVLTSTPA